ncbi:avidin-related protein 4/5-like [Pelobates fuscus]|uniref:avidin-related protein 4/5-like n=1 Tax=Pelobates fuscus TaxID=191477 RepID=UPI002FE4DFE5
MDLFEVLVLALLSIGAHASNQCSLAGSWRNELGSTITINSANKYGKFSGTYMTAVSVNNVNITETPLTGFQQKSNQPSFGFTLKWAFSDSITVFTGQCFLTATGGKVLQTSWLLRSMATNEAENWKATRVGVNTFTPI